MNNCHKEEMGSLATYDSASLGPLFAVSDEGSAGPVIVEAAYNSARARVCGGIRADNVGVALDGERMTSAGEVPIGPEEYAGLLRAARDKLPLTTNVGVRANARLAQMMPEFEVSKTSAEDPALVERVVTACQPFIHTPDGRPRPLTIRVKAALETPKSVIESAFRSLEEARTRGRIGPQEVHRISLLLDFDRHLSAQEDLPVIEDFIGVCSNLKIPELALDAELRESARQRITVQSLLNLLEPAALQKLLKRAAVSGVRLAYRYQLDVESAARTIWTGLHTARTHGFSAGKYGLIPMTLEEQSLAMELITAWTRGWLAIPAFYVDTPLLSADEVYGVDRCVEAARVWLKTARGAGVRIVLFDSPDRVSPRKLLRDSAAPGDPGVLTLDQVEELLGYSKELGIEILWSGGITSKQAFALAKRSVFGIFSTSSTAAKIAVTAQFERDPRLAAENEPTDFGVRRIHALIQGGFLCAKLAESQPATAKAVEAASLRLLAAEKDLPASELELSKLDQELTQAWPLLGFAHHASRNEVDPLRHAVPADAVRVFRGRKWEKVPRETFIDQLGSVFMPMTVQMQRNYGLKAYLPAVLPEGLGSAIPDEVALVFYDTKRDYHEAKRCVGGRAYGEIHNLVFDMDASPSGFPVLFRGDVVSGSAYHLYCRSVDWQLGGACLQIGKRLRQIPEADFLQGVAAVATRLQGRKEEMDAVIFSATGEYVVWWEHYINPGAKPEFRFAHIAENAYLKAARRYRVASDLFVPFSRVSLDRSGDFLNFHFQRR